MQIGNLEGGCRKILIAGVPFLGGQFGQGRGQQMYGVARQVGVGDMALLAFYRQFARQRSAPSVLGRIAQCIDRGRLANVYVAARSEEHTSELQSLMRTSYAVFCLKKKNNKQEQALKSNTL